MSFEEKIEFLLSQLARCQDQDAEFHYIFALIFNADLLEEISEHNRAGRPIADFVVRYINELIDGSYIIR